MSRQAHIFESALDEEPDVRRTVAVRGDQTLADLHVSLRKAFGWHGDLPYRFQLGNRFYTLSLTEPE
jgi:hypothetical protein